MDFLEPNIKYTISLDDIDLSLLPRRLTNTSFLKKEYYKFEIRSDVEQNSGLEEDEMTNYEESTCHICDMRVPNAFILEHLQTDRHKICLSIANEAADRLRKHVNEYMKPGCPIPKAYLCGTCAVVIKDTDRPTHETTKEHNISVIHDNLLKVFAKAYINVKTNYINDIIKKNENSNISILKDQIAPIISGIKKQSDGNNIEDKIKVPKKEAADITDDIESEEKTDRINHNDKVINVPNTKNQTESQTEIIKSPITKFNEDTTPKKEEIIIKNNILEKNKADHITAKDVKNNSTKISKNVVEENDTYTDEDQDTNKHNQIKNEDFTLLSIDSQYYVDCVNSTSSNFKIKFVNEIDVEINVNNAQAIIPSRNFNALIIGKRNDNDYCHCQICNVISYADDVHILSPTHTKKIMQPVDEINFIRNYSDDNWHCLLCNQIFSEKYMVTHITTKTHQTLINKTKKYKIFETNGQNNKQERNVVGNEAKHELDNINEEGNNKTDSEISNEKELKCFVKTTNPRELKCKLCDVWLPNYTNILYAHIKGLKHVRKSKKTESHNGPKDVYNCTTQNTSIPVNEPVTNPVQNTLKTTENSKALFCWVCDCVVPNVNNNIREHLNGSKHLVNQEKAKEKKTQNTTPIAYPFKMAENPKELICCVCDLFIVRTDSGIKSHLNGLKHKNNLTAAVSTSYN